MEEVKKEMDPKGVLVDVHEETKKNEKIKKDKKRNENLPNEKVEEIVDLVDPEGVE